MHKEQTLLWEMLFALSTEQLDAHLDLELEKEHYPDEEAVQTILAVLRTREKDISVELAPQDPCGLGKVSERYRIYS